MCSVLDLFVARVAAATLKVRFRPEAVIDSAAPISVKLVVLPYYSRLNLEQAN